MFVREWRNWQTRTFEGRVVYPYGFKSRLSHQKGKSKDLPFYVVRETLLEPKLPMAIFGFADGSKI